MKKSVLVVALILGSSIAVSLKHLSCRDYETIPTESSELLYSCKSCHMGNFKRQNAQNQWECHNCAPGCQNCTNLMSCKACFKGFLLTTSGACHFKRNAVKRDTVKKDIPKKRETSDKIDHVKRATVKKATVKGDTEKRATVKRATVKRATVKRATAKR